MTGRTVCVKPDAILDLVRQHKLKPTESWLLTCLVLEADQTSGTWQGTQTQLSDLVGVHRTRMRAHVDVLERWGLIEARFIQNGRGSVKVTCYPDVVHRTIRRPARTRGLFLADVDPAAIWRRDNGTCHLCGKPAHTEGWQMDHVIPIALLGPHDPRNVAVAHGRCNRAKRASAGTRDAHRWTEALAAYLELHGRAYTGAPSPAPREPVG